MNETQFEQLIRSLAALAHETEWAEFKCNNADPDEIGEYISAISNSAALLEKPKEYLVWGIDDEAHSIVGTPSAATRKK